MKSQAAKSVTEPDLTLPSMDQLEAAFRTRRKLANLRGALQLEHAEYKKRRDKLLLEINAADLAYKKAVAALAVPA